MKFNLQILAIASLCLVCGPISAQSKKSKKEENKKPSYEFTIVKENPITSIKNQNRSSTCWSFSTISFLESEAIKNGAPKDLDLSEMFVVYKSYADKAEKYVRLDGALNFAPGGSFEDVLYVFKNYGAVPDKEMDGLKYGEEKHVHNELDAVTKGYIDAILKNPNKKLSPVWKKGFCGILDAYLGSIPDKFTVDGKEYTPLTYAQSLNINPDDYVSITSYTHHPFYSQFVIEVPDNWRWGASYNVPMDEMIEIIDNAIENGYTIAWGADVSEKGFTRNGIAVVPAEVEANEKSGSDQAKWVGANKEAVPFFDAPGKEKEITQEMRQIDYDNKQTTDDHGMQIYGIAKDQNGTKYYMVKNSWGENNKYKGTWYVSEPYVKFKTMNFVVNKNAIPEAIRTKMGIK
jgi:Aminopeptidase C